MANVVVIYVDDKGIGHEKYMRILMGKAVAHPSRCKGVRLLEFADSLTDDQICEKVFSVMNQMDENATLWFRANPDVRSMCVGDRVVIQRYNEEYNRTDARTYRCAMQGWEEELPVIE